MKYLGCAMDFTKQRNNDLIKAYKNELRKTGKIVMPDIFKQVAESPASRFWVSEERAAIIVAAMAAGKKLPKMRKNKKEMFGEIFKRFLELKKKNPDATVLGLVSIVVNQPAPKFYLTPRTVGEFIYRIKNKWYEKRHDNDRCRENPQRE